MTREEASSVCGTFFNYFWGELTDRQREAFNMAIEALEEPKQGEWIDISKDDDGFTLWYRCSCCNHRVSWYFKDYRFCPKCGADMREGDSDA